MIDMRVSGDDGTVMEFEAEEGGRKEKENDGLIEVVRWGRFLPKMVLRVLLVEADDSTRKVIAALLRKCSYRVAAVPDGLMAWETLKGRPNNIDLILTELDLPSISGYALLTLVMEHDACKNIPVIMMSPHESISMVWKCILKGAADFLIKPVRKNELKNLWHHVWRRHAPNFGATAENYQSNDYASAAQRNVECTEKGSDTQGFSKPTCRNAYSSDLTPDIGLLRSDKASAIPGHGRGEKFSRLRVEEENHGNIKAANWNHSIATEIVSDNARTSVGTHRYQEQDEVFEIFDGTMDLIGSFDKFPKTCRQHPVFDNDSVPELELSLKRLSPGSLEDQRDNKKRKFNLSNLSAFSRYDCKSSQCFYPAVARNVSGTERPSDSHEPFCYNQLSGETVVTSDQQHPTMSNNQENITSCVSGQSSQVDLPDSSSQRGTAMGSHDSKPMLFTQSGIAHQQEPSFHGNNLVHSKLDIHDSCHSRCWSEETLDGFLDQKLHERDDNQSLKQGSPTGGESTCTNTCDDGVAGDENGSVHGSICGSESLNGENLSAGNGFAGVGSQHSSLREAALAKFRMKKKDRCFVKKVRYQSRKRLAEQRPRVKGQFARRLQNEDASAAAEEVA